METIKTAVTMESELWKQFKSKCALNGIKVYKRIQELIEQDLNQSKKGKSENIK